MVGRFKVVTAKPMPGQNPDSPVLKVYWVAHKRRLLRAFKDRAEAAKWAAAWNRQREKR